MRDTFYSNFLEVQRKIEKNYALSSCHRKINCLVLSDKYDQQNP